MPKMKTNKGAAKRFKITKTGKIKRQKEGARHIMTKKSSKRKRSLRTSTTVDKAFSAKIRALLHA